MLCLGAEQWGRDPVAHALPGSLQETFPRPSVRALQNVGERRGRGAARGQVGELCLEGAWGLLGRVMEGLREGARMPVVCASCAAAPGAPLLRGGGAASPHGCVISPVRDSQAF